MKGQVIKCSECEHCKSFRPYGNSRANFECKHPDKEYISKYFKRKKITKMEGFLGFGVAWSDEVPLKTSPAWCPRKRQEE